MAETLTEQQLIGKINEVITAIDLYQSAPSNISLTKIKNFLSSPSFLRFSIYFSNLIYPSLSPENQKEVSLSLKNLTGLKKALLLFKQNFQAMEVDFTQERNIPLPQLLEKYEQSLSNSEAPLETRIGSRELIKKAILETNQRAIEKKHLTIYQNIFQETQKKFSQSALNLGVKDKQLAEDVNQKAISQGALCAQKAIEFYPQFLKTEKTPEKAAEKAAEKALQINNQPLYLQEIILSGHKTIQKSLAAALVQNQKEVLEIETDKEIIKIEALRKAGSFKEKEIRETFFSSLKKSLEELNFTPKKEELEQEVKALAQKLRELTQKENPTTSQQKLNRQIFSLLQKILKTNNQPFSKKIVKAHANEITARVNPIIFLLYFFPIKKEEKPISVGKIKVEKRRSFFFKFKNIWNNFIDKHQGFNRFIKFIPKLRPSYWIKTSLRKTKQWFFRKAGTFLLKHAAKGVFKIIGSKLLGLGITSAATASGVGAPIAIALIAAKTLRFLSSPQIKRIIKKIGTAIALGAIGLIGFLTSHFFTGVLATGGALLGFTPVGAFIGGPIGGFLIGGTLGFSLDTLFQKIGFNGLGQAISKAALAPTTIATGASASPLLNLTAGASVILPLATVTTATIISTASLNSSFIVSGPQEGYEEALETKYLTVSKKAEPQMEVGANTEITYTITLNSKTKKLTNIQINDNIDVSNLNILKVDNGGVFNQDQKTITWKIDSLEEEGSQLNLIYQAITKAQVTPKTKINNSVLVTATMEDGTEIERKALVTINSSGSEIAQKANEIVQNLQPGFWNFYNLSPDYPSLFDWNEYNCCNDSPGYLPRHNHCYRSSNYPSNCSGNPANISKGDAMFWCSWLVVKSYNETGHPMPPVLAVKSMKNWFDSQGKFLPADTNVSQLELGDAIMFIAPKIGDPSSFYWAHVGIICDLDNRNDYIGTCESNNSAINFRYTVSGGIVQGQGRLSIGGFGKP